MLCLLCARAVHCQLYAEFGLLPRRSVFNALSSPSLTQTVTDLDLVYALPLVLLIRGTIPVSKGLIVTFVLGTLIILVTMVRFITLKVGTGQPNLVCELALRTNPRATRRY